jgi:ribonuclease E/ribonuclease G
VKERLFLVESTQVGLRAALVEDRWLQAIEIDRAARPTRVGSVTIATVVRAVHGIGTFLKLNDGAELLLDRGGPAPKAGDEIVVQITRAARGNKAGGASRSVSLPGRGVIHLPNDSGAKLSKRLDTASAKRATLEALVAGKPGGWIFRRTATLIGVADLTAEIATLAAEGQGAGGQGSGIAAPNAFRRLAIDYGAKAPDRILAAGLAAQRAAERWCRAFAPSLEERIESVPAGLFDLHDLDDAIAALVEPRVAFPGGGSLVIEPTEALTAIDVNAGPEANALSANLAAAAEIARQLRLRHIGGIIVIDFISMGRERDQDQVMAALKAAVADDPSQTYIIPMSPLGLVEMTRERRGPGLEISA